MKQFFNFIIISMTMAGLAGCVSSARNDSAPQSAFREGFSIGTIVEGNTQYLSPEPRQLFGSESGPPEPFTQKQEEMIIHIDQADLPAFLSALRSGIEEAIIDSGASIDGHGQGGVTGTSFSISYREGDIYGVINIWGVQGEGTDYYLIMMITEGSSETALVRFWL